MTSEATVPEAALLPCPFCGGAGAIIGSGPFHARCTSCGISTKAFFDILPRETIAAWNRRAALPHLSTAIHDAALEEAAAAGRRISAELRNAVHPGLGVKYDPRIRDTAANAAMRVVDAIETLKSIPAPAEGNEAEAAQEPPHLKFRREAVAKALTLDATDFIFNFDEEPDNDTVEGFAATLAIILAGYAFTLDDKGRLAACVAGDQGYAVTGIVVDEEGQFGLSAAPAQAPGELVEQLRELRDRLNGESPQASKWPSIVEDAITALTRQEQRGAAEVSESQVLAFLRRKYTHSSDARQKAMGLEYITAETGDLASEIAKFIRSALAATPVHQEAGK